jgi:hypothetical protein
MVQYKYRDCPQDGILEGEKVTNKIVTIGLQRKIR